MSRLAILFAILTFLPALAPAAEGELMHCFTFTPIEGATEEDWDAFYAATKELPTKIDGLNGVWAGKLRRPLRQFTSSGERRDREYGVCMLMDDEEALDVYADHPAHVEWIKVYEKVREPGTTTFDIISE